MKKYIITIGLVVVLISSGVSKTLDLSGEFLTEVRTKLLENINNYRGIYNLKPLTYDEKCENSAQWQATYLADNLIESKYTEEETEIAYDSDGNIYKIHKVSKGYYHTNVNPEMDTPEKRYKKLNNVNNIGTSGIDENIIRSHQPYCFSTEEIISSSLSGWQLSPAHNEVLLETIGYGNLKAGIGVSMAYDKVEKVYVVYVVLVIL